MGIVNPNPSQFRFLDYGKAAARGEQIQYGRLRNEALGMEVNEATDMLANRKKALEIRQQTEGLPNEIAALEAVGLLDEADKLRDTYIKTVTANADMIDAVATKLTAANYDGIREDMIKSGAIMGEMWPEEFDPNWARDQAKATRANLQRHVEKWEDDGVVMSQDIFSRGGVVDESMGGQPYSLDSDQRGAAKGGDNWKGWTATDSNAIGKQSERLYGGFYDPATGRMTGLDPTKAAKVQSVQDEAEQIYTRARNAGDPSMTHARAVAQAARKAGIKIEDVEDEHATNPLNLTRTPAQ
jgi:hypothetical protein